jgi:hypothetical protein
MLSGGDFFAFSAAMAWRIVALGLWLWQSSSEAWLSARLGARFSRA